VNNKQNKQRRNANIDDRRSTIDGRWILVSSRQDRQTNIIADEQQLKEANRNLNVNVDVNSYNVNTNQKYYTP
jgi:hypothetical protein